MSLRAFAESLEKRTGFEVAYDSARRYESGETRVPAEYVRAVCETFGISAEWLLLGKGAPFRPARSVVERAFHDVSDIVQTVQGLRSISSDVGMLELVTAEWERFTHNLPPEHQLRSAIVESWSRSRDAGVEPDAKDPLLRQVSDEELRRREDEHRALIKVAEPHLSWLSAAMTDLPHVVYLACGDGIILHSVTNDPDLLDQWGLRPGYDWSEETMGTNGAGTALASENVVAVLGPEHYLRSSHGCTCLAAPIRDGDGEVIGAIDVSTSFAGWRPDRLLFSAYAAQMIERELEG